MECSCVQFSLKATKQRPTTNDTLRKKKHEFRLYMYKNYHKLKEAYCYKSST